MRQIYFDIIYQYGSIIASLVSLALTFTLLFLNVGKKRIQTLSVVLIVLTTAISAEFYPFQLSWIPLNFIYPFTFIVLIIQRFSPAKSEWLTYSLFVIHSLMLIVALNALSVGANTWGDGLATAGVFQVPNSIVILIYLGLRLENTKFIAVNKIVVGIAAIITISITTNAFYTGIAEYDDYFYGHNVVQRRHFALDCSLILIIEGILYFKKGKKQLLITKTHL